MINASLCTAGNISRHYNCVREWVSDSPEITVKSNMAIAIDNGTAYHLEGSDCFLYYIEKSPWIGEGILLHGDTNPINTLAMLYSIFSPPGNKIAYINFNVHNNKPISEYSSLLDRASVKSYLYGNPSVKVDVRRVLKKLKTLNVFGVHNV